MLHKWADSVSRLSVQIKLLISLYYAPLWGKIIHLKITKLILETTQKFQKTLGCGNNGPSSTKEQKSCWIWISGLTEKGPTFCIVPILVYVLPKQAQAQPSEHLIV